MDEIRSLLHDLSNKLVIVDGKLKKAQRLCCDEQVTVELAKALNNSESSLEILKKIKDLIYQQQEGQK